MPSKKINLYGIYGWTWSDISLFLVLMTLPLTYNLNSWALILLVFTAIFSNRFKEKKALIKRTYYWIFPIAYYCVMAASVFWDRNGWGTVKMLEKHTSFLILPIIFASLPAFSPRVVKTALFLFVASVSSICISCLIQSFIEYKATGDNRVFFYHYLSQQMGLNAIYLSLFVLFSILILLFYCYIYKSSEARIKKIIGTLAALFLSCMLLLLSAKMLTFLFFLLVPATVLYIFYLNKMLLRGVLLSFALVLISGYLLWQLPYVKWRIEMTVFKEYEGTIDNQNGLAARRFMWQSAVALIAQKPLLGYGIKNGSEELVEEYKRRQFVIGYENNYNAHNTYLQVLLNTGLLGLLPVLAILGIGLVKAFQQRNYLFICLMLILIAECCTEALLETQRGIVFFLMFILLFYYHSPEGMKGNSATPVLSPTL